MNRSSDRKAVSRECPICGETMVIDPWSITLSNTHYEQIHPEYQKWFRRWTEVLLVIGLLGALTLAVSLAFFFPCGIACQSNPFDWVGFYELLGYTGVMGLLVFQYLQGLGRFKRDWREGQGIVKAIANSSEDEQILRLTGELCHELNTPKLVPKRIFWKDVVQVPIGESSAHFEMPSDLVSTGKGNIVLPKRMQGVLTIEEWKPLIASSLIFMRWIRPKMVRTLELSILGVLWYAVATFLILQHFGYGIYSFQGLALHPAILLLLGVSLFVLTGRYFSPEARHELFRADQKAADLYGRDAFVRALQKIDNMGFADVRKLEQKKKRSVYDKPSVAERLQNLSSLH